nr:MAG TPA: hypothetical protein [Caudoviricetes sp.]
MHRIILISRILLILQENYIYQIFIILICHLHFLEQVEMPL